jgi:hypothetical protein
LSPCELLKKGRGIVGYLLPSQDRESEISRLPVVVGLPCSALAFDLVGYFVDLVKDVAVAVYEVGDL